MHVPSATDVVTLAGHLGFDLDEHLKTYVNLVGERMAAFRRVDELVRGELRRPRFEVVEETLANEEEETRGWTSRFRLAGPPGGPLTGRTIAVKQSMSVAGTVTDPGNQVLDYTARQNATVVERLLIAGAVILGKSAATDFEHDGSGVTGPGARVRNPRRPDFLAGGSSTGSAALVAGGHVEFALGGDAGGSIREPASWSGCVGLKPTHGLVPTTGGFPFQARLADYGPLAADVAGCALVLGVIADGQHDYVSGLHRPPRRLRVGVLEEGFAIPGASEPDVDDVVHAAIQTLAGPLVDVVPVSVPMHREGVAIWNVIATEGLYDTLVGGAAGRVRRPGSVLEYGDATAEAVRAKPHQLPVTSRLTLLAGAFAAADPVRRRSSAAHELGDLLRAEYDQVLDSCDVLVMPTTPARSRPRPTEPLDVGAVVALAAGSFHNAAPFNVTGHPAISVTCGEIDGLPIGLQIVGRHHHDQDVLAVAGVVEGVLGRW